MRAGVDIGGTFTDLCIAGPDGIVADRQGARHAVRARGQRRDRAARRARARGLCVVAGRPRHDARDQRADRAQGREGRAAGHGRVPRRDGARARAAPRHLPARRVAAGAAGAAPPALRRRRAHAGRRRDRAAGRRARGRGARRRARRARDRGDRDLLPAQLHEPGERAERRARRWSVRRRELRVAISSDVAPEIREYERTQTTAASVYVQDRVVRYLDDLEERLSGAGRARSPARDALQRRRRHREGRGRRGRSGCSSPARPPVRSARPGSRG